MDMTEGIPINMPIVVDVELSQGEGVAQYVDGEGVTTTAVKLWLVNSTLSNGSSGPVLYNTEAAWKLFWSLHEVFGDAYHKMHDSKYNDMTVEQIIDDANTKVDDE